MAEPIDFYFDFISPYGYLGSTQIEALAARHGREVRWHPMLLGVTVMKIMGLKPLMETPLKGDYIRRDKPRLARRLGVPLASPDMSGANSIAPARAFYWLHDRDPAKAIALAKRLLQRLWVDGREITSAHSVAEEAAALGLDRHEVLAALGSDAVKDRLRTEVDASVARGVFGSPFFIADGEGFWGVDRLPMLDHWLTHHRWDPEPG